MATSEALLLQIRAAGVDLWVEDGQLRYRMPKTAAAAEALAQIRLHKAQIAASLTFPASSFEAAAVKTLGLDSERGARFFPMRVEQIWRTEWRRDGQAPKVPFDIAHSKWIAEKVQIEKLRQSVSIVVQRHDALRSRLAVEDGRPVQVTCKPGAEGPGIETLSGPDRDMALRNAMERLGRPPIDLVAENGFRCRIFRDENGAAALGIVWHHYFCDHWSVRLFMREVEDCYRALERNQEPALPQVQSQYADYAGAQRQALRGGLSAELRYWRGALADAPPSRLPYDHRRDTRQMAPLHFHIGRAPAQHVKDRARALHIGFFAMLFAAYQLSLARWSQEEHVTGAVSVADRFDARFAATLGYLITALPLHSRLEGTMTVDAFAQGLSQRLAMAYSHRNLSYELYDALYSPPQPFCPTLFNFIAIEPLASGGELADGGLRLSSGAPFPRKLHHRELYFELMEFSQGLRGRVFYNTDFFATETIEKFVGRYAAMLARMVSEPALRIGQLH